LPSTPTGASLFLLKSILWRRSRAAGLRHRALQSKSGGSRFVCSRMSGLATAAFGQASSKDFCKWSYVISTEMHAFICCRLKLWVNRHATVLGFSCLQPTPPTLLLSLRAQRMKGRSCLAVTLASSSIRAVQRPSACIRQHTSGSAHVSIRQHTSAYVSIPPPASSSPSACADETTET
jgi:hypothetical protein